MNSSLDTLCYIQEQSSFEDDYDGKFGYEVHDRGSRFYVTFPAILQSFGHANRNGREYDFDNIVRCIETDEYINTMLKNNSWMGELDHPDAEKTGEDLTVKRIANVDMRKSSHYIRSPKGSPDRKFITANIQTDSSNEDGMNLAIKVVDGHIVPCFSARVLGSKAPGTNKIFVRKLVTYDAVLFPSHKEAEAQIHQPLMESVDEASRMMGVKIVYFPELARMAAGNSDETKMLCEAFELTEQDIIGVTGTGNSVVLNENGNTYVQPISSSIIRKRTKSALMDMFG